MLRSLVAPVGPMIIAAKLAARTTGPGLWIIRRSALLDLPW